MSGDLTDGFDATDVADAPMPDQGTQDAAPPAPAGPSIDDAIAAAFAKQTGQEGQPRDDAGRFAPKAADTAPKAPAKPEAQTEEQPQQPAAPADMPSSWGKDKATLWQQASPELQAFLRQREEQISSGFKRYEGCAEYADVAAQNGRTLRDVLAQVDQIEQGMMSRPVETLVGIMKMFQVDPAAMLSALQGQGAPAAAPPAQPAPLAAPVIDPSQITRIVETTLQQRQTQQEVNAFFSDPANKYADTVSDAMAALLRADRNLSLKDAYEQAIWAHPQVRQELLREQAAKAAAEQAKQVRATTQTAQRASRSLVGTSAPASTAAPRQMSIEESIRNAVAIHG